MTPVSHLDAFAFHKASGYPLGRAVEVLTNMEPLLRQRVIQASHQPRRALRLSDPIESDPATAELVRQAGVEAQAIVRARGPLKRGSGHAIWREQARILAEKHQLTWFSPQEMNPGVFYD